MKRNSLFFLVAIILLVLLTKCSKQTEIKDNQQQEISNPVAVDFSFSVKNGMLSFPSVSDYKKAIDFLAKDEQNNFRAWDMLTQGFVSERILQEQSVKSETFVDDDVLASLLNRNGEIQIAGKIYKVLNNTQTVEVIDPIVKTKKLYTFDEEVLSNIHSLKKSDWINTGRCPANLYWPSTCNPNWSYYKARGIQGNNKISYKVAYYKYGIYFTLVAKIKKENADRSIKLYINRCSGYVIKKKNGFCLKRYFNSDDNTNNKKLKIRPYYNTKRLADYEITADFGVYDVDGYQPLLTKHCPCK